MDDRYRVTITSRDTGEVNDVPLTPTDDTTATRRLIRPKIVNNAHEAAASVQITLMHQRRHKLKDPWQDADDFSLATLKGGQEVRFNLSALETWRLWKVLSQLYAVGRNGVPPQSMEFVAVPSEQIANSVLIKGGPHEALENLQAQYGEQLWEALAEIDADFLEAIAVKKRNDKHRKAVGAFQKVLESNRGNEEQWRKFFAENLWIFGHGLDYRILHHVEDSASPVVPPTPPAHFTVLVEIKTPQALLLETEPYYNGVHRVGPEVVGGVAQVQSECRSYGPKAVLVIGNTSQLDTADKRAAFEMFRRNLHNPEILTFDELLARAKWMVERDDSPTAAPDTA